MNKAIAIVIIGAVKIWWGASTGALANQDAILSCLRSHIVVGEIDFGPAVVDDRSIKVEITNGMRMPLGGVWVSFEIWASDRPQPLYVGSIREAATIPGALMPGETLIAEDFHFMDDRAKAIARDATKLRLSLSIENAADTSMQGFLPAPAMASWSNATSDQNCTPRIAE